MEFRHGGLRLDLPDGWLDQSTLLFVAPPTRESTMSTHRVVEPSEAVSVNFVLDPGDPKALLAEQARSLAAADPDFEVLEEAPFACGLGDGWCCVQRMAVRGVPVRQIAVACAVGPVAVVATAAAPESSFGASRARLRAILESMRTV